MRAAREQRQIAARARAASVGARSSPKGEMKSYRVNGDTAFRETFRGAAALAAASSVDNPAWRGLRGPPHPSISTGSLQASRSTSHLAVGSSAGAVNHSGAAGAGSAWAPADAWGRAPQRSPPRDRSVDAEGDGGTQHLATALDAWEGRLETLDARLHGLENGCVEHALRLGQLLERVPARGEAPDIEALVRSLHAQHRDAHREFGDRVHEVLRAAQEETRKEVCGAVHGRSEELRTALRSGLDSHATGLEDLVKRELPLMRADARGDLEGMKSELRSMLDSVRADMRLHLDTHALAAFVGNELSVSVGTEVERVGSKILEKTVQQVEALGTRLAAAASREAADTLRAEAERHTEGILQRMRELMEAHDSQILKATTTEVTALGARLSADVSREAGSAARAELERHGEALLERVGSLPTAVQQAVEAHDGRTFQAVIQRTGTEIEALAGKIVAAQAQDAGTAAREAIGEAMAKHGAESHQALRSASSEVLQEGLAKLEALLQAAAERTPSEAAEAVRAEVARHDAEAARELRETLEGNVNRSFMDLQQKLEASAGRSEAALEKLRGDLKSSEILDAVKSIDVAGPLAPLQQTLGNIDTKMGNEAVLEAIRRVDGKTGNAEILDAIRLVDSKTGNAELLDVMNRIDSKTGNIEVLDAIQKIDAKTGNAEILDSIHKVDAKTGNDVIMDAIQKVDAKRDIAEVLDVIQKLNAKTSDAAILEAIQRLDAKTGNAELLDAIGKGFAKSGNADVLKAIQGIDLSEVVAAIRKAESNSDAAASEMKEVVDSTLRAVQAQTSRLEDGLTSRLQHLTDSASGQLRGDVAGLQGYLEQCMQQVHGDMGKLHDWLQKVAGLIDNVIKKQSSIDEDEEYVPRKVGGPPSRKLRPPCSSDGASTAASWSGGEGT